MSHDDDSEFAGLLRGVKRLHSDRVNVYQQRSRKDRVTRRPKVAEYHYTAPDTAGSAPALATHFHSGLQKKLQRRIRQGLIRPEACLDLHGFRQSEALATLEVFLHDALALGLRMVIIIHGQGYRSPSDAVLKPLVQRWLAQQGPVLAWCPAQPRDGAAGASYVYLRSA